MKKIAILAGSVALLVATVLPAVAANNCTNSTTGPLATNYCTITNSSSVSVNNTNNANISNSVSTLSNSGGNSASYNTLGAAITTGNATLNATVSNLANVNTTTVNGGPAASSNSGVNEITGPNSDDRVTITNTQSVAVNNINNVDAVNRIAATSDSGNNVANYNTGPATIQTGSSRVGLALNNHFNDSATGISAGAGGTGSNSGLNSTTGPFSTDYVTITNTAAAAVNNVNNLGLDNTVDVLSRSGANSASYNTLGGDIGTGNATGTVGLDNEGNINTTTVQMAMGGFGDGCSQEITGPLSDNRCELLDNFAVAVNNPNNSNVTNSDSDVVDSGNNASDYNTGGGSGVAGLTDLVKSILNHLNDSWTVIQ